MKFLALLLFASAIACLTGFILGCVPWLNEHLHWNFLLLIPISGLVFGSALAWMQSTGARYLGIALSKNISLFLSAGIMLGYMATDLGLYMTLAAPLTDAGPIDEEQFLVRDLLSFHEFMSARLGSYSIDSKQFEFLTFGGTGAKISYAVDLAGAYFGALLTFMTFTSKNPYCEQCNIYMEAVGSADVYLPRDSDLGDISARVQKFCSEDEYKEALALLQPYQSKNMDEQSRARITCIELRCGRCKSKAMYCTAYKVERFDWIDAPEASFVIHTPTRTSIND